MNDAHGAGCWLSICIPTYNRAKFIRETLDSIASQQLEGVELIISDNASADDTAAIVDSYRKHFSNLTYFRWPTNQGADRNYLKAVELARGEYCWLLGSDDVVKPGVIQRLKDELKDRRDIYLFNRTCCDIRMKPLYEKPWLSPQTDDRSFFFNKRFELLDYFNRAQSLGAVFSYISSILFRREAWNSRPFDESYIGTAYSHVYKLLSVIESGAALKYLRGSYVLCRGFNDSFATEGEVNRIRIDFRGYRKLADRFFAADPELHKAFLGILRREHRWYTLLKVRVLSRSDAEWSEVKSEVAGAQIPRGTIWVAERLAHFRLLVLMALRLKRVLIRVRPIVAGGLLLADRR